MQIYENSAALVDELAGKMHEFSVRPEIEIFDLSRYAIGAAHEIGSC
jgi:hypothetical protein